MSPALRRRIRNHIFSSGVALCGGLGTAALGAMFLFLLAGAFPALRDQGLTQMLLSPVWEPSLGRFGLLAMFCATIAVSIGAVLLGLPVALFSAAFAQNLLPRWLRPAFVGLLELMSGLPSVLFGLVGLMTLLPALSRMFPGQNGRKRRRNAAGGHSGAGGNDAARADPSPARRPQRSGKTGWPELPRAGCHPDADGVSRTASRGRR